MPDVPGIAMEKDKGGYGGCQMWRLTDKLSMQLCAVM